MMNEDLVPLIVDVLCEVNGNKRKLPLDLGSTTPLFGQDGILDSLGLVSLIVAVEQTIEDKYGASISLADEKALSQRNSPYRTVGSLAEYASRLIHGSK